MVKATQARAFMNYKNVNYMQLYWRFNHLVAEAALRGQTGFTFWYPKRLDELSLTQEFFTELEKAGYTVIPAVAEDPAFTEVDIYWMVD